MAIPALMASASTIAFSGDITVTLTGGAASDVQANPETAEAGWAFFRTGNYQRKQKIYAAFDDWIDPKEVTVGDDYEIRATLDSGDTPTGTLGSWLALSSTRAWELVKSSGFGTISCSLTIEIRDVATQTVQDSGTYTISAQRTF